MNSPRSTYRRGVLAVLLTLCPAAAAATLKLEPGTAVTCRASERADVVIEHRGMVMPEQTESTIDARLSIESALPDGGYRARLAYQRIRSSQEGVDARVAFDTAKGGDSAADASPAAWTFRRLTQSEVPMQIELDPRARVSSVPNAEAYAASVTQGEDAAVPESFREAVRSLLSEPALTARAQSLLVALPEGELAVGTSWSDDTHLQFKDVTFSVDRRYEVVAIETDDAGEHARIALTAQVTAPPPRGELPGMHQAVRLETGAGRGEILLATATGVATRYRLVYTLGGEVETAGGHTPVKHVVHFSATITHEIEAHTSGAGS